MKWFRNILMGCVLAVSAACSKNSDTTPAFDAARQAVIDDDSLKNYLTRRNLLDSVTKTSSGLYFRITKPVPDSLRSLPEYQLITNGKRVFVYYEGKLLNEVVFDGNLLSARAFIFTPGAGSVIPAWEEGLLYFRKGEEGYLYAPSRLGYANRAQGRIPANSCLRFFIRVSNVE